MKPNKTLVSAHTQRKRSRPGGEIKNISRGSPGETLAKYDDTMLDIKGLHIRSIAMKNLFIWIVLISTAALGVAVAEPTESILIASVHSMTFIIC